MKGERTLRVACWLPLGVEAGIIAAYFYFDLQAGHAGVVDARNDPKIAVFAFGAGIIFCALGCFIASHRPRNPLGWILAVVPLFWSAKGLSDAYAWYGFFAGHARHGGAISAWFSSWDWVPAIATSGTFLLLLFPDGHLPSQRWRPTAWLALIATAAIVCSGAFAPGPLSSMQPIRNPFGAPSGLAGLVKIGAVGFPLLLVAVIASASSLFFRARRSSAVEREQVKWLAYAACCAAVGIAIVAIGGNTLFHAFTPTLAAILFLSLLTIPIASAVAIQRYRLFEIDKIISRTLSYAAVTSLLGGLFALIVLVPTAVIGSQGRTPQWLVAMATLTAVALFRPVRRRVQSVVDMRFNRSRYDAAHTIESFGARLREQVDLDSLSSELCAVVRTTMEPERVSLWIRDPDGIGRQG